MLYIKYYEHLIKDRVRHQSFNRDNQAGERWTGQTLNYRRKPSHTAPLSITNIKVIG